MKKSEQVSIQLEQASKIQEVNPQLSSREYFRAEEHTVIQRTSNINIAEIMETVDTFASEQIDIDSVEISDEIDTEALNALVGQLTGQTQREATPDEEDEDEEAGSDTGSMQASTGSEGLEEQFNTKLDISDNADNKSNGEVETTKKEQSTKSEPKLGTKEKSKEEKSSKSKKKEDKTIDHILRALSSLQSTEEKLAALCKKYADLHEEHRVLQSTFKQSQRKLTVVTREKDQLQTEHTKAVMAKSKLESLCRELQKHNQVIRQESLQRAREEDEKRKEISNKFQTAIGEIQQQMQDHHDRNMKLREENQELAGKLKQFIEQYETREKQVEKVMQHRELEQKLADAKLQQANAILQEEQERSKKEKELLFLQASEGQKKATLLEAQLGMYKESYEEFQSTINKSNDMFQKFKTDMDKMSKKVKKLEKEGAAWKSKWEKSNKALIEMAEDKTKSDQERQILMNKIQKLESLCRAMQAERLGRKVIEAQGLDPSKLEGIAPSSTPPSEHLPATNVSSQAVGGAGAEGDAPTQGGETQTCPADSTTKDTSENCDCPNDSAESDQSDGSQGSEAANESASDETSNKMEGDVDTKDESEPNQTEVADNSQT
ncbi:hypothetical protein KUTeg_007032 [Tegillarca granosa]|uniref:Alpha-taxilin n=1 Tax=Tegillarca granosa TaxID=220873 RepID=A0ABQ9FEF0_TEGGR|nr:hypothetical protein KUTeg_007032 [Tegillarca granosa]